MGRMQFVFVLEGNLKFLWTFSEKKKLFFCSSARLSFRSFLNILYFLSALFLKFYLFGKDFQWTSSILSRRSFIISRWITFEAHLCQRIELFCSKAWKFLQFYSFPVFCNFFSVLQFVVFCNFCSVLQFCSFAVVF